MNPQELLVVFGAGALLLQIGFAMQSAGVSRRVNASSSVFRILVSAAVSTLAYWAVGQALFSGTGNPWVSVRARSLFAMEAGTPAGREFFGMAVAAVGGAVVSSAVAERSRFRVSLVSAAVFAGLVYPIAGRWVWGENGWLAAMHFVDFGGAVVVHLSAAVAAAVAVAMVGPRRRAGAHLRNAAIAGHSVPMSTLGVMLLGIGWFPYLLGSMTAHATAGVEIWFLQSAAINLMLAAAAGTLGGLLYGYSRYKKPDLFFARAGFLGGMVAISSSVIAVGNIAAVCIGLTAGLLVPALAVVIDDKSGLDDPAGVIAVHGGGAVWGALTTAVFALGLPSAVDHVQLLGVQCLGMAAVVVTAGLAAALMFAALKLFGPLRVSPQEEAAGLDMSDHGLESYPTN